MHMTALTCRRSGAVLAAAIHALNVLIVGVFIASGFETVAAQTQSYLREMPPPSRVMADHSAGDAMAARARQVAALFTMLDIMRDLAGDRGTAGPYPNGEEKPIFDAYVADANRLRNEGLATFGKGSGGLDSPRARWSSSIEALQQSRPFKFQLLKRYFSPTVQGQHATAIATKAVRSAQGRAMIDGGLRDLSGRSSPTWDRMTATERDGALQFGGLMVALLLIGLGRELLPFDINGSGLPSLRYGLLGRARLHSFTGVVTDYKARDHSTSTLWEERTPAGAVRQFWTSVNYRHEEFDLVHDAERHHVHIAHESPGMSDAGEFNAYAGRPITAVWVTRRFRNKGPYILFRSNPAAPHDIHAAQADAAVAKFLSPRMWTVFPAIGLGFVIGSSTDILSGILGGTSGNLRGLALAPVAVAIWFVCFLVGSAIRTKRFQTREMPRLRALVDGASQPLT
jgi:hypothetical protein